VCRYLLLNLILDEPGHTLGELQFLMGAEPYIVKQDVRILQQMGYVTNIQRPMLVGPYRAPIKINYYYVPEDMPE